MIQTKHSPEISEAEQKRNDLKKQKNDLINLNKKDTDERKKIENLVKEKQDSIPDKLRKQKGNMPRDEKELNKRIAEIN